MKKFIVLGVLFILPIVAYLFFASGVHNFAKLPVIEEEIPELKLQQDVRLENKITVLGFLGNTIERDGGDLFNLNQKIFKSFSGFDDFQFVYLVPESIDQDALEKVTYELSQLVDLSNWYFIQTAQTNINTVFNSLNTPYSLQEDGGSPYIFIIDKDRKLRGRDDDEDYGVLYGYDSSDIAELADKMKDDVKIVLAEYRLALKKNNADRKK
ncbi:MULTISPECIES: hypothetical protein [Leeuwenhoekiella]|mgnify:FL=1|jgi:hypothetical protein|uniref:hypothetical protein n=1 Tax=Leeuwenhoekiella TaxID=283735 RepID=UPI000C46D2A4|nr:MULTISPECIES: hypothetical protein [Leeuwenhoekiella]MAO42444.1 hypothetical protein [Leeuwenhoekiella sp.]MBQ51688.1 hypothetical protein [Leeuwenhoekiella sp.]HBT10347.1 hypothetical protein [Leeuwenhoekiella sp.]HCW65220.1 hypothetical protein [Leeuwenhoekiella sp.]|tara:strand:+ start:4153 stop:4785 length:633 start_codon:yes stop_codon:yes gene_type:complete